MSDDAGRTWDERTPPEALTSLAMHPSDSDRVVASGARRLHVSRDGGRSWRAVGEAGGPPAAFEAEGPGDLYVALHDGTIRRSTDGGRSWSLRSAP